MERVLVVSPIGRGREALAELLEASGLCAADYAETAEVAKNLTIESDYALILINAPIRDGKTDELAIHLARNTQAGVILLLRPEDAGNQEVAENGVMTLIRPVARQLMQQAVRHALAVHARLKGARRETERLQLKLDEVRTVNRAKAMLIMHLSMSEDAAHRYIEKQAMDLRLSRMDVAKNILKNYSI